MAAYGATGYRLTWPRRDLGIQVAAVVLLKDAQGELLEL